MNDRTDIIELRLAYLRAATARTKGWHHVAVQNLLYCHEALERSGDERAALRIAAELADCYRAMGLEHKARSYRSLA